MSDYRDQLDSEIERANRRIRQTRDHAAAHVRSNGPVTGRAVSRDGSINITVRPGGSLVELNIGSQALMHLEPDQLADEVVRLARQATRTANSRLHLSIRPVLGPEVTAGLAELGIGPGGVADEDGDGLDFLGRPR
jgi:hypothetical protein